MSSAEQEPPAAPASPAIGPEGASRPTRMVRKEQQAGWVIVAVTVVGLAASWAGDAVGGDSKAAGLLAIGLALTAVLAAAVWYGQRVIASFAAIVAGFAPVKTGFIYLSFACLGYGGFLMFRSSRAQMKTSAAARRTPGEARQARQARAQAKASARAETKGGARSGPARTASAGEAARRPNANRRYTPPKAKRARRGR